MNTLTSSIIQFHLPPHLSCPRPTEERHLKRDEVRLLVTTGAGQIDHTHFRNLSSFLRKGDVLVFNTSATIPAALSVTLPNGNPGKIHLSTRLNHREWLVEVREVVNTKTRRWKEGEPGMIFNLPDGSSAILRERFHKDSQSLDLWEADVMTSQRLESYLAAHGRPIQYEKLDKKYPLDYYQTFFSFHPGSSEMPSAGRGFTPRLIERLIAQGVTLAPILLHTGVSSLEENETPYPEFMEMSPVTSSLINAAKDQGRRIIAVGTTAVRALESAINEEGRSVPYRGNTDLFISESYDMKVVDGLLTGFHEPRASHLNMLQSIAGYEHIEMSYQVAIDAGYYWHQFGDLHLILP